MLTQEELKLFAKYNPDTGIFTRIDAPCNSVKAGEKLGWISKSNRHNLKYLKVEHKGKTYTQHRLAWLYMTGSFPEFHIDHIDGDGLNNKWSNLRDVCRSVNGKNSRLYASNKSGQAGVSYYRPTKKWRAAINDETGKKRHLGYFDTLDEAVKIRKDAELTMQYHANHGKKRMAL